MIVILMRKVITLTCPLRLKRLRRLQKYFLRTRRKAQIDCHLKFPHKFLD
jgi:hypothetical protein